MKHLGAWLQTPPGGPAPRSRARSWSRSGARHPLRYLRLVAIVALAALLLVGATSSERPQAQAQSGDATPNADADCQVPPTGLASTSSDDASGVVLTWLAPASCTPAGYAVYRRNMSEDGSRMQQLATVGGDTLTYTDTDVEAGKTYRYRVRSNDLGPRSDHTTIDVPEAEPEPAPRSDDRVVRADQPGTVTLPATFTTGTPVTPMLTDPDGVATSVTWQWARAATAGGTFTNISTMESYTPVALDVGNYLRATASYTDPEGSGKTASATSTNTVAGTNAAPAFSSTTATRTLPENSGADVNVVGGTITAADADNDTLTYSLASGGDNASFEIDSSGQIETKTGVNHNFNFEATKKSYTVTVNVHDGKDAAGGTDTSTIDDSITVTINLTNVDEPGTVTLPATFTGGTPAMATLSNDPDGTPYPH